MSRLKPAQQFDESDEAKVAPEAVAPAQEIDETLWQDAQTAASERPIRRVHGRLARLVMLAFGLLVLAEAGWTLWQAWQRSPVLFGLYSVALGGGVWLLLRLCLREWRRLRQLKRAGEQRQCGQRILDSAQRGEAPAFVAALSQRLPEAHQANYQRWQQRCQPHHSDGELLLLYERTVLSEQDRAAQQCIYRFAAQASLLLAASPMATLDMALMLWRNQAMLDEVARIYGIEPGYLSRVRLVRGILVNLLYAGGSELAVDLGTQMLSTELTGKLSARIAQGLGAGLLTARLGFAACAECRPLPYQSGARPSLLAVQGKLLAELTRVSADALRQARQYQQRNDEFTI
ncbi:TIGR01620 family protein [Ferrimonas pelagia]|uniref:TIGR01620 family protein n=1 Tax=Ferrimonas pelagia TaxID=1177826 RepID=A0ABP9EBL6_9GAMM